MLTLTTHLRIIIDNYSRIPLFFLIFQAILKYIKQTQISGAVLVFLPGWNVIFALLRHLSQHPIFGKNTNSIFFTTPVYLNRNIIYIFSNIGGPNYLILPLHSQLPREDQRKVFDAVPESVTKVRN